MEVTAAAVQAATYTNSKSLAEQINEDVYKRQGH